LIAVPVKSFDSGDSNRDLHMLQVTRGAQFPLVTVRTRLPDELNLSAIESYYEQEERGYPPYHPRMMTKILVYGYCVGVFSSRRLQKRVRTRSRWSDHATSSLRRRTVWRGRRAPETRCRYTYRAGESHSA
jgi:hypothetical protein